MKQMKYEATQEFERLAETISDWFTPIIRMWRFTKNNGITEGFHRKMKLIQRMAYGYRNFENYRLRVLVLCGVFHYHPLSLGLTLLLGINMLSTTVWLCIDTKKPLNLSVLRLLCLPCLTRFAFQQPSGVPTGIRTPVLGMKIQCPRPG